MTQSSFYGDTPNYATDYPTQNDSNTQPVTGNTQAPSSFYPNGGIYEELANSDTVLAELTALEAQMVVEAAAASTSATNAATSATNAATSAASAAAAVAAAAGTATPLMDGVAAVGVGTKWSHEDHVHPTDTSRADAAATTAALALKAPLASPALTGTPTVPTAAVDTNTTQAASTAFVLGQASAVADGTPAMDGTAARGAATHFARADHVHPTDTSRAPLASPTFTGTPAAPTATVGTNTTQLATTAFVAANSLARANNLSDVANAATARSNLGAAPAITTITASLGADVLTNNTANYFDGPSVAQGTSGTWFVSGTVSCLDTAAGSSFYAKLWDGTTVIASGYVTSSAANFGVAIALSGYITSPAGNLRISCREPGVTTGKIVFNATGNSKDSTITAIRIA